MPDALMSAVLATTSRNFIANADGYRAHAGGLDVTLRPSGLQANADDLAWSLALGGWGRGEQIVPVSPAEILRTDHRLEYRRGALIEWYRDTAVGVEQGLTVSQAPGGEGPLLFRFDLFTDLSGRPDAEGRGLSFATPEGRTLRYDHLRAWDASGSPLEAHLLYVPGRVTLQVNDHGATYPITIDPLIYVEHKIVAPDGAANDLFGSAVVVSGDTAVVTATADDVGAKPNQGAAYVLIRNGSTWSLQQILTASDGEAHDGFGSSVALSGETAILGAHWDTVDTHSNQGSAYVFVRSGTTWSEQAHLTAFDGAPYDGFGISVALSGDTAIVGAYKDQVDASSYQGSAYVFTRSGSTWSLQQKLTASDGTDEDYFGRSVALWGETALVTAPEADVGTNPHQGATYVFVRSGTTWTQQAKLSALDGATSDGFGGSSALSGETALVGAYWGSTAGRGSAYVFTRNGTTWTQEAKLTASDGATGDRFGSSVALSGDMALVGASDDDVGGSTDQGSAYVFTRTGTTWSQQLHLVSSDGQSGEFFGNSVALSGNTALVGTYWAYVGANDNQGAAYFYGFVPEVPPPLETYLPLVLESAP